MTESHFRYFVATGLLAAAEGVRFGVNGINIGKLFRDQFADAMQRNGNDLDKTIDGWAGEVAKAKETTEQAAEKQAQ